MTLYSFLKGVLLFINYKKDRLPNRSIFGGFVVKAGIKLSITKQKSERQAYIDLTVVKMLQKIGVLPSETEEGIWSFSTLLLN